MTAVQTPPGAQMAVYTEDRRATPRTGRSVALALAPVIGVLGFLGLWQLYVELGDVKPFVLPSPWRVIDQIAGDPGFYARNARSTLWEAFLGFVIGAVAGVAIGSVMAHSRFIERAVLPIVVLIQVTPIVAYAAAIVIWRGYGLQPIVIMTALICVVPFLINAVSGVRSVDPNLLELARSVDAGPWEIYRRLRLPSALPALFSAARIAVGLALIGAVLGEMYSGVTSGLGFQISYAQGRGLTFRDQMWGCIFTTAVLGAVATLLITILERFALHWHSSQRH